MFDAAKTSIIKLYGSMKQMRVGRRRRDNDCDRIYENKLYEAHQMGFYIINQVAKAKSYTVTQFVFILLPIAIPR